MVAIRTRPMEEVRIAKGAVVKFSIAGIVYKGQIEEILDPHYNGAMAEQHCVVDAVQKVSGKRTRCLVLVSSATIRKGVVPIQAELIE